MTGKEDVMEGGSLN